MNKLIIKLPSHDFTDRLGIEFHLVELHEVKNKGTLTERLTTFRCAMKHFQNQLTEDPYLTRDEKITYNWALEELKSDYLNLFKICCKIGFDNLAQFTKRVINPDDEMKVAIDEAARYYIFGTREYLNGPRYFN